MKVSRDLPIGPEPCSEELTLVRSQVRSFKFSFQSCDVSDSVACQSLPDYAESQAQSIECAPLYTHVITLPSSTYVRIPCPRLSGATQDHEMLDVTITYSLRAAIYRRQQSGNHMIAETSSEICILDDSLGVQPPTCISDFGLEYHPQHTVALRTNWLAAMKRSACSQRAPLTEMSLLASEPRPLILHKTSPYATTSVPLTIRLCTDYFTPCDVSVLRRGTISVSWRLQKSVFCAFEGFKDLPTLQHVSSMRRPTAVQRKVTLFCKQAFTHEMHADRWQRDTQECSCSIQEHCQVQTSILNKIASSSNQNIPSATAADGPHQNQHHYETETCPSATEDCRSQASASNAIAACSTPWKHRLNPKLMPTSILSTDIPVPIHIQRDTIPMPTSFTPYMTTRYSVQIQVAVSVNASGASCATNVQEMSTPQNPLRRWHRQHLKILSVDRWTAKASITVPAQIVYDFSPFVVNAVDIAD